MWQRTSQWVYSRGGHYLQLLEQISLCVVALFALLGLLELFLGRVPVHGAHLKQAVCGGEGRGGRGQFCYERCMGHQLITLINEVLFQIILAHLCTKEQALRPAVWLHCKGSLCTTELL